LVKNPQFNNTISNPTLLFNKDGGPFTRTKNHLVTNYLRGVDISTGVHHSTLAKPKASTANYSSTGAAAVSRNLVAPAGTLNNATLGGGGTNKKKARGTGVQRD
jgi:hypothetical protein